MVEGLIDRYRADGRPLPPATAGHDLASRLQAFPESTAHRRA